MDVEYAGFRFSLSAAPVDQSVLAFVDRADGPTLSVTVAHEKIAGGKDGLMRYVADQLAELRRQVPGYTVVDQRERTVGERVAVVVEATINAGRDRRGQRQVFVLDEAGGRVVVMTVNAQEAADKRASETVEELLRTLRL